MLLSVIIPCYNEEDNINPFFDEMEKVRHRIQDDTDLELVFVDDGSSDRTFDLIYALSKVHPFVKYVRFSRNFGKEAAMLAGLENALGDYVVLIDADLQDPPELLPEMIEIMEKGEMA